MPEVVPVTESVVEPKAPRAPGFTPDDWARYEPTVERLIRGSFRDGARAAIDGTVKVNTTAMRQRVREILELLRLRPGQRVGDFGCGYGFMPLLLSRAAGVRVEAFDRTEGFLEVGRRFLAEHPEFAPGVRFERLDHGVEAPPAWATGYDAIILHQTFHYIVGADRKREALRRLGERLAPGGRIMVYVPNPWYPREPFTRLPLVQWLPRGAGSRLAERLGRRTLSDIDHVSPWALARMMRAAGLGEVRHVPLGRLDWREASGRRRRALARVLCPTYAMLGTRVGPPAGGGA